MACRENTLKFTPRGVGVAPSGALCPLPTPNPVCDRFADSTLAYQGGGLGLPLADLARMNALAVGDTRPDLTILLDLDPEVGLARVRARAAAQPLDRFEAETLAFPHRVRATSLELARREPERIRIVDATAPAEALLTRVRGLVDAVLS